MKRLVSVCVAAAALAATAVDGVWTVGGGVWTNTANWADGVLPDAGGTAAFVGSGGTVTVPSGYPFTLSAIYACTNGLDVSWNVVGDTNTLVTPALVRVDTNTLFLSSPLAGTVGIQKTGGGTLKLQAANPLLSGSIQVLGGRLLIAYDSYLGQAPAAYQADAVVLDSASLGNDDATVTLAETRGVTLGSNGGYLFGRQGNDMVMASPITGVGPLYIITQSGYVRLSNTNNNYTGDTVLGSYGPGYFNATTASGTLKLGADEVIPDGAGAGGLIIDGAMKGVLDLGGKTETVNRLVGYSGAVITNSASLAGVLRAGSDGGNTSFSGSLKAGVTLDKIGAGTLTYSNTAACAGILRVSAGAVSAGTAGAIDKTTLVLDGGALKTPVAEAGQRFVNPLLLSQDGTLDCSSATVPFVWSGPLLPTNAVGVPALTVSGGSGPFAVGSTNRSAVFAINVNAAGGVLFTNRVWLDTLPLSSSWSIANGSDVAIGAPGLLGSGPMTLSSYSARLVASDSLGQGGEPVAVEGAGNSLWFDATSDLAGHLTDNPAYAFTASNNVALTGTGAQVGFDGAGTVIYTGAISGNGALVKSGSGDAVLESANSFVGAVQVNAGRLLVSDDSQLGNGANAITLTGGYLGIAGASPLTLARTLSVTSGGIDVPGAALELDGVVNGTVTKRGAGTLVLGGAGANSALDLYVAQGVALLGKSGAAAVRNITGVDAGAVARLAGTGGNLIVSNATLTGGALDLSGISESVAMLSSTSLVSVVTNSGASATLTVGEGDAAGMFYGSLADAAVTLTKTGTNVFTLAGAAGTQNAGALNVAGGTLAWGTGIRCVRVRPGATRSGAAPAIGELQLTLHGQPLPWPAAASTSASSASGTNNSWWVNDNNSRSYWQASGAPAWIIVDAKTPQLCDGYRWYTSNMDNGSDPLNWTVEVSADNVNWFVADVRASQTVTTARGALGGSFAFSGAWPSDVAGDATDADIASGARLNVMLSDEAVSALTGSGTLALAGGSSLRVDDLSGFSGTVSGNGTLLLGGGAALQVLSAAGTVSAVGDGPAPTAVTVGTAGEPLFGAALADGASTLALTKQGSGTLTVTDVGSTYSGDTRVEQGTLKVQAPMWRFRYIRFNPTQELATGKDSNGYELCIAEFQLVSNGVTVAYPVGSTATAPYTSHSSYPPSKAINGLISGSTSERWLSTVIPNPLTIDTKTSVSFNGYRVYESGCNGSDYGRTPTTWTVEGSDDGATWMTLCGESGVSVPPFVTLVGQSLGDFSAKPMRFKLPLEFYSETNSAALKVAAVRARYLRFTVTDTRLTTADFANTGFQLDELQLMRDGAPLLYPAGTVATAPGDGYNDYGGRYFPPQMAVDNVLPVPGTDTNRWYSVAMVNPMTVDMGQQVVFDAYRWYTGPNGTGRDPLGWKLEVSNNATNWYTVDMQTNQNITVSRNVIAGTWALDIPAGLKATDAVPDSSRTYVASGATLRIDASSETVGPLSGTGTVSLNSTVFGVNGFEDAAYAGGITGTGTVEKVGSATQTLSGALSFSGGIIVEAGTLDLTGATLTGVTNIVIRSGGLLTGAADVSGNLTVAFEGGAYGANLNVSGALTVTGSVTLAIPDGAGLPYTQRLFAYGSADAATKAALDAATTLNVPAGYRASVNVSDAQALWAVAPPGTVLLLR